MYEVVFYYMLEEGKIMMWVEFFGWQWYDVIEVIDSCFVVRRRVFYLFVLNFKIEK